MKALVYHGPGQRAWEDVPDPTIQEPTDAIVRIDSSTICGTDLHILKGDVPEVKPGTILGHEAVGHGRRDRKRRDHARAGRPRARLLHHVLRAVPLLQGRPLRALHRRRGLDLRPPHRRAAGRVRARAVRRHLGLQGAGRAHRRAGPLPRRHPPDRVRGRRPQRTRRAGRHGRDRRRRPDRARGDHDRAAPLAGPHRRDRPRFVAAREGARVRCGRGDRQQQGGSRSHG